MHILQIRGYENIVFQVIGDGPLKEHFVTYAKDKKINVVFRGRLPYPDVVGCLAVSDIAVNPIVPGAAQSIINKHGDYAMAGLPVVSTQNSAEYINLLRQYNAGITCTDKNPVHVADAIEHYYLNPEKAVLHGRNSRRMGEELFDRETTYKEILAKIDWLLDEEKNYCER